METKTEEVLVDIWEEEEEGVEEVEETKMEDEKEEAEGTTTEDAIEEEEEREEEDTKTEEEADEEEPKDKYLHEEKDTEIVEISDTGVKEEFVKTDQDNRALDLHDDESFDEEEEEEEGEKQEEMEIHVEVDDGEEEKEPSLQQLDLKILSAEKPDNASAAPESDDEEEETTALDKDEYSDIIDDHDENNNNSESGKPELKRKRKVHIPYERLRRLGSRADHKPEKGTTLLPLPSCMFRHFSSLSGYENV